MNKKRKYAMETNRHIHNIRVFLPKYLDQCPFCCKDDLFTKRLFSRHTDKFGSYDDYECWCNHCHQAWDYHHDEIRGLLYMTNLGEQPDDCG